MWQYFEGAYFKCSTKEKNIALIPAVHCDGNKKTASLQIVTEEGAFNVPVQTFSFSSRKLKYQFGRCSFSERGIILNVKTSEIQARGKIRFGKFHKLQYDIMGPFCLVPFLQCWHRVFSMMHELNGKLEVNGESYHFVQDIGYIEGDRGSSFPKEYVWTQCHFPCGSLMLSVADIPFCGVHFKGIIAVIILDGKEYRLATYLGARIRYVRENEIVIQQGKYLLEAKLIHKHEQPLNAPQKGCMARVIHESASCVAAYQFVCGEQILLDFESNRASFEYELFS